MRSIDRCKFCKSSSRVLLGTDTHEDKYLKLIDSDLNKETRNWYRCNDCNFIYRSPVITEKEADILYAKYRSTDFRKITSQDYFDKLTSIPDDESEVYSKAVYIKENIKDIGSILDVGCGGGILLWQLRRVFPLSRLQGLEPNKDYARMVRDRMKIDVVEEFYTENNIDSSFDLTVSTDVIEHIHDINIFWKAANNNINNGKYLFIETPAVKNFEKLDITNDVFEVPHLYFFSKYHVINIANKHGFNILDSKQVNNRGVYKDWYIFVKG
jgi:SAM-dependent methyltransferase